MPRNAPTQLIIYEFVCKNPGACTYEISKKLNMSGGRVRHALNQLRKNGLIKFKYERKNPRIKKLSYPVSFDKLLPRGIKRLLQKI